MKSIVNGSVIFLALGSASMVYKQNEMINHNDKIMMVAAIVIIGLLALFSYNRVNISPTIVTNRISDLIIASIAGLFQTNTRSERMVVRARNKRK